MAPYPKQPLVDLQNPCYCPSLPARAYIHTLHQSVLPAGGFAPLGVVNHFTKALAQSVHTPGLASGDKGVLDSDSDSSSLSSSSSSGSSATTTMSNSSTSSGDSGKEEFHSAFSDPHALSHATATVIGPAPPDPSAEILDTTDTMDNISFDLNHLKRFTGLRDSHLLARPRKRKGSSASDHPGKTGDSDYDSDGSNIRGPSKRARSTLGTLERSFQVRLTRKVLNYDVPSSTRPLDTIIAKSSPLLVSEPYYPSSPDSPLVDSSTPPPPRVSKEKFDKDKFFEEILDLELGADIADLDRGWTVQEMVDYLAGRCFITGPLMKLIGKHPDLSDLSLTASFMEIYSYNPSGIKKVLSELHTPGAFRGLVSLDINFVPLDDDDVLYLHHLQTLQYLSLRDTCITNTAIYLLTSHRRTLIQLDICCNPAIDDDAIVPLLDFKQLRDLSAVGTGITMEGLRLYAMVMHEAKRKIHIDIPKECEQKLRDLDSNYLVNIFPPLVSDPEALQNLTLAELRTNLNAHWEVNDRIVTTGNKNELRERLQKLLERRKADLLVRDMVGNRRYGGADSDWYDE